MATVSYSGLVRMTAGRDLCPVSGGEFRPSLFFIGQVREEGCDCVVIDCEAGLFATAFAGRFYRGKHCVLLRKGNRLLKH